MWRAGLTAGCGSARHSPSMTVIGAPWRQSATMGKKGFSSNAPRRPTPQAHRPEGGGGGTPGFLPREPAAPVLGLAALAGGLPGLLERVDAVGLLFPFCVCRPAALLQHHRDLGLG